MIATHPTPHADGHAPARRLFVVALTALTVCAPRATLAEITPEAREVVERYLEATGGRAAFEAEKTVHLEGTITAMGLSGTFEGVRQRPDRRASATALGPLRLQEGFDGTTAWRIGPDGKMVKLDGIDLEDAKASTWFENERWLEPDQGGGTVRVQGEEREGDATFTLLEVTPPVGKPRTLWFDGKTGLVDRVVVRDDARVVTVRQSDWRRASGRLVAFSSVTEIEGMLANTATLTLESIEVNVPVAAERFAPPDAG